MTLEEMLKNAPNIRESEGMRYIKSIPLQPAQKPVIQENFNPDEFLKSIPMPQVQKGFADKRDMSVKLEPLKSKKKEKKQNLLEQLGSGIEKSYDKYAQNNPDTPNWLKPLGYAVETPYRIPFVNRLLNSASETAVGKEGLADNAVSKQYSQNAGKIGNVIADIAGAGLGMGVNPANQGLNQIGNAAEMFALKQLSKNGVNIATKEGAKLAENILPYLGQAGVKGLRSAAEMGTLGGMQANIEGANANDTTKAALGSAGMGFAFGSGSKVLGDSLTLFNKAKNEIKSTVSEAQKQGLINAYAERFGVPPETMTEAILKDQPLLLTAPSKPMEAPLNVLPGGDTIPMGGKIEGSRPVVRILKNRTETPNPTIEKYGKKFTVKNTLLEKAQQDYDNAIQQIQNATGHYKLTDDEILNAAVKLGIDPFKLIDNIEKSQSGINLDKLGERARLARLAGLNDNIPPLNKTNVNIENKPVFSGYVDQKVENPAPPKTPFQIDIENQATAKRLSALTGRPYEVILKELQSTNSSNNQVLPQYAKENPFDVFSKPAGSKTTQGNANIPLNNSEPLKPSIGATDRTKSTLEVVTSKSENKLNPRTTAENIYTHAIDINQPIKKVGNDTFVYATNSKKIGGTVNYILNDALVDREGKKIGESLKDIASDIPRNEENNFINYVLQRHNIDRSREDKPIFPDFTPEQSAKAVKLIEQKHPEYKSLGDRLVKFINTFENEWGYNAGLLEENLWNQLQKTYPNYVPTQRGFEDIEQGIQRTNGKGFVDQSTPLNRATGSERDVKNPIENIANLINRTVRTARYNEVGQNMLKAIRGNSELSKYAEILPDDIEINPNVKNVVSVLENGKPVNVEIHDKNLLEALQGLYKTNDVKGAKAFKIFNDVFKSLITQKNPVFAIRNIARDLPTGYVFGSEKNPFKYLRDVVVAGKDLFKNTEIAQQYKALGGENANFLNTKKMYKAADRLMDRKLLTGDNGEIIGSKKINPVKKGLSKLGDAVETFNNVTESAPRLAEFKRTLGKTGDLQKALYEAGEITTNFSRGGDITKKYDVFVPYLNAGVQGLDKLARQIRNKPIATAAKGIIGIGALTIVLDQVNKDNPNYKQLDNRTKDNYFLFPHGDTFIKIPKSRELGVAFGSLFERIIRSNRGDKQAFKGFLSTVKTNISPANPLENNILSPLMVNIPKNKDFADRSIVPENMKDRSPQYQYDEYTSEVAKKLGQITKLSPKQIDYLIKSYTGVIGQLGIPATTKANYESGTPLEKILKPVTTQFIADPLYSNNIITNFYDNYDKLKQKAADKNFIEKIPGKEVTEEEKLRNAFAKASKEISDLNKQAKEAEKKNDITKVKELRKQMIKIAGDANKLVR